MEEDHPFRARLHKRLQVLFRRGPRVFKAFRPIGLRDRLSSDCVEEQEHIEQLRVLRLEERRHRRVLDMGPADVLSERVEHHRQPFTIVGMAFGDEHDLDRPCSTLRRSAASAAATLTGGLLWLRLLRRRLIGAQPSDGNRQRRKHKHSHQRLLSLLLLVYCGPADAGHCHHPADSEI